MSDRARASDPLVTVIIPAYNGERFLARTLASISRQTYRNIEIIVHDDGSTDATPDIVAAAARVDDRIRHFSGENAGVNSARNAAAARARGEALAPCDQDDLWHPEKLEKQVTALYLASPDVGVVYCGIDGINESDAVIFRGWSRATAEGDILAEMLVASLPGCGSNVLMRREVFDAAGGYLTGGVHSDDWSLYIVLASICKWAAIPDSLVGYRMGSHNNSRDYEKLDGWIEADKEWIIRTWPDLYPRIAGRRIHETNRYLSFQAVRRRHFLRALHYRAKAIAAHPRSALSYDMLIGFPSLCLLEFLGVQRYYWPPWRSPGIWPGALGLDSAVAQLSRP